MADEKPEKVDKAKAELFRKAGIVKRIFASEDGKDLLDILRREFLSNLKGKDEHETVFKAGQADAVAYLMQLNNLNGEGR